METELSSRAADLAQARRLQWLALSLTPGIGAGRGRKLVERFGAIDRLFAASLTELEAVRHFLPRRLRASPRASRWSWPQPNIDHVREAGATIICAGGRAIPPTAARDLRSAAGALSARQCRGRQQARDCGRRHAPSHAVWSWYGRAPGVRSCGSRTRSFSAAWLAASTRAAHRGALNGRGRTVAIWGTGIDEVYPKENRSSQTRFWLPVARSSREFPLGTFPAPQNFPIRNRIISGISIGVLVIEAGEYSGTRVTARCALEQGREVYAVPGERDQQDVVGP